MLTLKHVTSQRIYTISIYLFVNSALPGSESWQRKWLLKTNVIGVRFAKAVNDISSLFSRRSAYIFNALILHKNTFSLKRKSNCFASAKESFLGPLCTDILRNGIQKHTSSKSVDLTIYYMRLMDRDRLNSLIPSRFSFAWVQFIYSIPFCVDFLKRTH